MATTASTAIPRVARPRPVYARIAVFGMLMIFGALLFAWAANGFLIGELAFIGPIMAIALVVAGLGWRFGTWSKILIAIAGVFLVVGNIQFIVPALGKPEVFFDFVMNIAALTGALLAAAGGVAATVKRRDLRSEATEGERRIQRGALLLVAVVAAASGTVSLTSRSAASAADRAGAVTGVTRNIEYSPDTFTASATGETRFVLHNSDRTLHTFTIDGVVDQELIPGSDAVFSLSGLEPGTYEVYCKPHSHKNDAGKWEGMVATLEVK